MRSIRKLWSSVLFNKLVAYYGTLIFLYTKYDIMNVNSKGQRRYFISPERYISKAMKNCFFICSTYRYNRFINES